MLIVYAVSVLTNVILNEIIVYQKNNPLYRNLGEKNQCFFSVEGEKKNNIGKNGLQKTLKNKSGMYHTEYLESLVKISEEGFCSMRYTASSGDLWKSFYWKSIFEI